jgi:hypothetical protein
MLWRLIVSRYLLRSCTVYPTLASHGLFPTLACCLHVVKSIDMTAVAHVPSHDVHPLLRHPRPITRDSAKAQRMLGLITDTEEKLNGLHREKSQTTKWLERPMYAHLDVSDVESEKEEDFEKKHSATVDAKCHDRNDANPLEHWSERPTSFSSEDAVQNYLEPKTKLDVSFNKKRPQPLASIRPVSYNPQHLLTPEWTVSPAAMSPYTQQQRPNSLQPNSPNVHRSSFSSSSSSGTMPQFVHPQTWPTLHPQQQANGRLQRPVSYQPPSTTSRQGSISPFDGPELHEQRPRPTSFATYQHRDRRKSKIASSRGLRNNSYPNFSRPISEAEPTEIPGPTFNGNVVPHRFDDREVGPPSPSLPVRTTFETFELGNNELKNEKKPKKRWSTIPETLNTLKKFANRRTSGNQEPTPETTTESLQRMNLTEDSLTHYQGEVSHTPVRPNTSALGVRLLLTPSHSPLEFKHPLFEKDLPPPFAPWADAPPSPTSSLSPTKKGLRSRLSIENFKKKRPESMHSHSRKSSLGMPSPLTLAPPVQQITHAPTSSRPTSRYGTPSLERSCILCKTTQEPTAFINHRISGNCWHEPASCYNCLKSHIERCVKAQGWDHCSCPECGELISYDDMAAFAEDGIVKWED